ncbi:MAG: hypothetical protein R6U63_13500 [Longimicrobiales bacterium]
MRHTSYRCSLIPVLLGVAFLAAPVGAQEATPRSGEAASVLSSEISVSQDAARLEIELSDGQTLSLSLTETGAVRLNDERIGGYDRRDALDQAWRDLLQRAMDTPTAALADLLVDWEPPAEAGGVGGRLDRELEAALSAAAASRQPAAETARDPAQTPASADAADSIRRLNERIRELERTRLEDLENLEGADLQALRELRTELERDLRDEIRNEIRSEIRVGDWTDMWSSPWRHITRGLGGVFSTLMSYAILVGLGFLAVFFGRKHLEGIADTARHATLRSGLVGLAGSFLVLPAYILGLLALAVSIVGIPLILVFAPLFPVAVVLAAVGGYLAVAHGAGEALAERRFTGNDWFNRANSYYYVITGVGLLLVLFLAAHIVSMAGPWLGFLEGLLKFMAIMLTWAAFTIGFGAFLVSRGGTRPVRPEGLTGEGEAADV